MVGEEIMAEFQCSRCGKTQEEGKQIIAFTHEGKPICERCTVRRGGLNMRLLRARMLDRQFKPQFVV